MCDAAGVGGKHTITVHVCAYRKSRLSTYSHLLPLCLVACRLSLLIHSLWVVAELLTLGEAWWVVIDVSEPDSDGGGPR